MKKSSKILESRSDRVFLAVNYLFLLIAFVVVAYPLYYVVISSFSEIGSIRSAVPLLPGKITLDGYRRVFMDNSIWRGYLNSIVYTAVGTSINLLLTLTGAYAMSRSDLPFRRTINMLVIITMFVNSGLIPRFLLVNSLGLMDSLWALVLPNAITVYNLLVARSFFRSTLPGELLEASQIDGCSDFRFFVSIALPLSKAIIAVLTIYYGVMHWNAYFNALIYLRSKQKAPLQLVLRNILVLNETLASITDGDTVAVLQKLMESIKYSVIILASLPMMILYPYMQKFFVKGVMLGSVKG